MAEFYIVGLSHRENVIGGEEDFLPSFPILVRASDPLYALKVALRLWNCERTYELVETGNRCFYSHTGADDLLRYQIERWAHEFLETKGNASRNWNCHYLVLRPEPLFEQNLTRTFVVRSDRRAYLVCPGLKRAFVADRLNVISFCTANKERDVSVLLNPGHLKEWSHGAVISSNGGGTDFHLCCEELWQKLIKHLKVTKNIRPNLHVVRD